MIVYKQLREIVDLVLSIPFRKEWVPVLRDLSVAFHTSVLLHFPDKTVPKVHYVCEYAQCTHDYGPMRRQWCFRYEAAHAYFKKLVLRSNNFKNIPKMLATRFAFKQAFRLSRSYLPEGVCYAVTIRKVRSQNLDKPIKQLLLDQFGSVDFDQDLVECRKLFHHSIEYRCSSIYIIGVSDLDDQPVFGQVVNIVRMKEKWWIIMDLLRTVGYDEHLFAWNLKSIEKFSLVDPCELRYFHKGLDFYALDNSTYVSFSTRLTAYR